MKSKDDPIAVDMATETHRCSSELIEAGFNKGVHSPATIETEKKIKITWNRRFHPRKVVSLPRVTPGCAARNLDNYHQHSAVKSASMLWSTDWISAPIMVSTVSSFMLRGDGFPLYKTDGTHLASASAGEAKL